MNKIAVAKELAAIAKSLSAAGNSMFFNPNPDWDTMVFNEQKHWVWEWVGGGWNQAIARSKKEALAIAKKKFPDMEVATRTCHVPTEHEYRMLMID